VSPRSEGWYETAFETARFQYRQTELRFLVNAPQGAQRRRGGRRGQCQSSPHTECASCRGHNAGVLPRLRLGRLSAHEIKPDAPDRVAVSGASGKPKIYRAVAGFVLTTPVFAIEMAPTLFRRSTSFVMPTIGMQASHSPNSCDRADFCSGWSALFKKYREVVALARRTRYERARRRLAPVAAFGLFHVGHIRPNCSGRNLAYLFRNPPR